MQEEIGLGNQMIDDQLAAQKVIIRYSASFVIQHAVEIGMFGKYIHTVQPVDGEGAVDHDASRQQANSPKEIGVRATAELA